MKPPLCKVCDHHHYGYQPHVFAKSQASKAKLTARKGK